MGVPVRTALGPGTPEQQGCGAEGTEAREERGQASRGCG